MNKPRSFNDDIAFQTIFQAAVEGIVVVDKKGSIILANEAGSKMFGYEISDLKGKNINSLIPRKLRGNHRDHMTHYMADPKPRSMGAGRSLLGLRKNGHEFPIEVSLSPATLAEEHVTIAFCIDITERKMAEEALKKSEEQLMTYASELENKVAERTEKLNDTVQELEEANLELQQQIKIRMKAEEETQIALSKERDLNELKSRFVSMASHEFRTPLSTILSSASLIGKYTEQEHIEKRVKHINRIKSSVANLTNILDDFLSLGKLEEGRVDVGLTKVDLFDLANNVIDELNVILKPGQEIRLKTNESTSIETDDRLLKNVLINLTSNAIKYSPANSLIEITMAFDSEKVKIDIRDHGIGIPDKDQSHLFTRFFRAGNATNLEGTGLGLNIVKKYLELLKGAISFKSKLNEGSTFTIELPLKYSQ